MRIYASTVACVLLVTGSVWAGEAQVRVEAKSTGAAKKTSALELVAEEERWLFRPTIGRPDVFIDLEAMLQAQLRAKIQASENRRLPGAGGTVNQPQQGNDVEQLITWGRSEEARVRQLVAARKYEEAMKAADSALKPLEPLLSRPDVAPIIVSIRTYRAQAEEAKIRDDAQLAFEALKIRVLGVLWSQDEQRMAIIDGENRALSVNDRVKDCVVINIDQDRVDFRFVFGRRRFEFPVYVDQSRSTP
jgi:hypothetical protein